MQPRAHRSSFTLLLIGALVLLLTLLALLQYRWLGQISVAERQTMAINLRNQARGLQEEFTQEIERAGNRLRVSREGFREHGWDELIERYARWKAGAAFPGLIKDLFVARAIGDGQFELKKLNEQANRFGACEWPANFSVIPRRFGVARRSSGNELPRREKERAEEERGMGSIIEHGYVLEEIPAVVRFGVEIERMEEPRSPEERERMTAEMMEMFQQSPLIIIVLDFDYIRNFIVPSLFERRFTVDGALDYQMSLVNQNVAEEKKEKSEREIGAVASTSSDASFNLFAYGSSEKARGPRWQVVINHRAGSLDAAVAQARSRNLAVSFGILSLLAVSVIIIIVISRRAQRLARRQMDFVAGVSHEFRTPLAVIHAVSENLADGLITDKQQIEQCGVVIRNDARRLASMVEQVLEFAGASRGKSLYQPHPVNVSEVIDRALAANPIFETQKDWRVEKEIESDLPAVVADPAALESAVRNLIDNAIKYCGDSRWIGIKARAQSNGEAPRVEITIADKGIGIPASDLSHIFEPFYRGREVAAAQLHGNGLGLSLVKNIIEAHGGTIAVSSTPGEGSSFSLSLPAVNGE